MPIRSKAQWRKLAVSRPGILKRWLREYPARYASLPERTGRKAGPRRPRKGKRRIIKFQPRSNRSQR